MTKLLPVPRRFRLWLIRESKRIAWGLLFLVCLVICIDTLGVVEVYFERDFQTKFNYPLDVPNFPELVRRFGRGEKVDYQPINENYSKITFLDERNSKCQKGESIGLLILVKSAPHYFEKRAVIRKTWGNSEYLRNLSRSISNSLSPLLTCRQENGRRKRSEESEFPIKLVFLLGKSKDKNSPHSSRTTTTTTSGNDDLSSPVMDRKSVQSQAGSLNDLNKGKDKKPLLHKQSAHMTIDAARNGDNLIDSFSEEFKENSIQNEILKYNDIVLADFMDNYENNTYKTMIGIRYAMEKCNGDFQFALLCDDDMHINLKNLIRFLESPREYPFVNNKNNMKLKLNAKEKRVQRETALASCNTLENRVDLYAGKVLTTRPIRYKLGQVSKWYVSLQEYPFNNFPPYMPAAAIIMSKPVVQDFYWASYYTEHFRFDDVYLGLLAFKMNINPLNSNYFYVCHNPTGKCGDDHTASDDSAMHNHPPIEDPLKHLIARHGFETPEELLSHWEDQKAEGNLDL